EAQGKYNEALKRKQKLDIEAGFYQKKPMPPELTEQMKANESEIKAQQLAMDGKKKEMEQVKLRFDEEKKRYIELMRGGKPVAGSGK
ncbi:MAG: hypothetical protein HY066_04585, partial [Betaproteobacteria bacterium]|nr:hypothetical protein [Betaproteobacteria bacterium]